MFNKKHFPIVAFLFSLLSFCVAAADGESLWGYADPTADVVVYINTTQPEKAMEKSIWDRIQQDKNRALKEKEGRLFDTKNRDMELIANLRIVTLEPFCGTVEGVANISGDLQGDIDNMMELMKQREGTTPQVSKKDNKNFYNLSLSGTKENQKTDFMLVPIGSNQIQFRININPQDTMPQTLLSAGAGVSAEESEGLAKLSGQDVAFACFLIPERFADMKISGTESTEALGEFLKKVSSIGLSAQASGVYTILKGSFSFKSEIDAAMFAESAEEILPKMKALLGSEQSPRSVVTGRNLEISIPLNTSDAWDMISRFTNENGSLEFFGIDEKSDDPVPTKNAAKKAKIKLRINQ